VCIKEEKLGRIGTNPIESITEKMPNGFHDSILFSFRVDYVKKEAEFIFGADVSDAELDNGESVYRHCRLILRGLYFLSVEPQLSFDKLTSEEGLWSDVGPLEKERLAKVHPFGLPRDVFANWIYSHETNAFIYIAARNVDFEWLE
jgi:hypothetical protein